MMKRSLFIILFAFIAIGLSAQNSKGARKAVRSGNKSYKDQLYGTAEADYRKALEEDASSKEASFNLANTYYKQQRWDDALKEYQHYLTLEGENPEKMSSAWSNIGNTYLKKKANEKAAAGGGAAMMGAAAGQQQQQPQAGRQEDNLKQSMEAYKNALRLNPADDDTRYNLAVVQKMLKDKEDQDKDQNQQQQKQDQKQDQNQKQDPQQPKDQKQDQQQQQQNQMSEQNMQQILQALEQDEKNTQERVKQAKAQERKKQNENNRKQNKDW